MTNEEALAILQDGILSGHTDTPENNDALDIAISALENIDRITAERDAAINDLSLNGRYCVTCKYFLVSCKRNNKCLSDENEHWEWRGIKG